MEYLGDGVYVEHDGYQLKLCANSPDQPTDVIYLDAATWTTLAQFVQRMERKNEEGSRVWQHWKN